MNNVKYQDWTPCKEMMPEDDPRYAGQKIINILVTTNNGTVTKVQRISNTDRNNDRYWWWGRVYGECKAWMPLPEPYKY